MIKVKRSRAISPDGGEEAKFAYHAGPADIVFAGRAWKRGEPQPVAADEFRSMTRRAGWVIFDFRRAGTDPAAATNQEN